MNKTSQPLRAAVVGLRIHAGGLEPDRNHGLIKSFHGREDARIAAYCEWDPDEQAALESLARHDPSARIYTSLSDLLDREEFDVAVVMLPPNEATQAAIRLAEAGKHLFIEKQAARSAPELLPLCRLAEERNLVVQVGYPWPRHPVAQEIRRCLDEGVLGKLLAMEARLVTVQIAAGLREPDHWMYRLATEGGGILHMEGGHWLALFQMFAQARVRSVTALCSRRTDESEEGVEDAATVALEYANGVHACLHMGYMLTAAGPRDDTYMAVRGNLGAATWEQVGDGQADGEQRRAAVARGAAAQLQYAACAAAGVRGAVGLRVRDRLFAGCARRRQSGGQHRRRAPLSYRSSMPPMNLRARADESSCRRFQPHKALHPSGELLAANQHEAELTARLFAFGQQTRLFVLDSEVHRLGADIVERQSAAAVGR